MPARSRTTASTSTPKHPIPIGLQIAARLVDGLDADWKYVRDQLRKADARAVRILRDPLITLEAEGALAEIDALAKEFGSEAPAKRVEAAVRQDAPKAGCDLLTDAIVPYQNAAMFLGLCLGWRMAAQLNGGAR